MSDDFEIPEGWEWSVEFNCYVSEDNKAYDSHGKHLKGFADPRNKSKINTKGRPKGSRDKSSLREAQLEIDGFSVTAVDTLKKVSENKWKDLGLDRPVPVTAMVKAANILLDKAVSQEKEKQKELDSEQEEAAASAESGETEKETGIASVVSFKAKT